MEVVAFGKRRILRNLAGYLPVTLVAGFIYCIFGAAGLAWVLDGYLAEDQVKLVAAALTPLVVVVCGVWYVRFVVNRLAQSRLALEGDTVIVRGQTSGGLIERRYAVGEIAWVAFGEQLSAAERVMDRLRQLGVPKMGMVDLVKDLKAGRLVVADRSGQQDVFHFVDKVFDLKSLVAFAIELSSRGVAICGLAEPDAAPDRFWDS